MSKITKLKAQKRDMTGSKVKRLRNQGIIPSNIFGSGVESVAISITAEDFYPVYKKAGETGLIEIDLGDDTRSVLISDIQLHPVTDEALHVDFLQVDLKKKVSAAVPVELIGESPAEKEGIGIMVQQVNELEVEALPLDLPESFELSVEGLATLDDFLTVADIKVDTEKIEIQAEPDLIIANITEIREEEPEPIVEGAEETEEETAGNEASGESTGEETKASAEE